MQALKQQLDAIRQEALASFQNGTDQKALEELRVKYLGKKSALTNIMKELRNVSEADRPLAGSWINDLKVTLTRMLETKQNDLQQQEDEARLEANRIDVTLPGQRLMPGRPHVLNQTIDEIVSIFKRIGFVVAYGPEVETDYYNFEALNIPKDHSARDMWDTFYVSDHVVLRTHTSPVQIRVMEKQRPPVRILAPGRVYRNEAIDASHHAVFYQLEGLFVDKNVTFADLKGELTYFVQEFFGANCKTRFRPSFFPFTEPSAEVDVSCVMCQGKGCNVCKHSGWLEILGCGMVNPAVYKFVNYDPEVYTGYAFGMGIERITMLKYRIDDIRLFLENDLRFLHQF